MEFINTFFAALRDVRTEDILRFLKESQISELMHSPYFLGTVAAILIVCLVMKWRLLLATVIGIVGFAELLAYTVSQDTSLDGGMGSDSLMVFVGGGIALVVVVIYLLFIKSE